MNKKQKQEQMAYSIRKRLAQIHQHINPKINSYLAEEAVEEYKRQQGPLISPVYHTKKNIFK